MSSKMEKKIDNGKSELKALVSGLQFPATG